MQAQERWWPGHHGLPGLSIPGPSLLGLAVSSEPSSEGKKPPWRHIPGLTPVRCGGWARFCKCCCNPGGSQSTPSSRVCSSHASFMLQRPKKSLIENKSNPISKIIRGLAEHINLVITALIKLAALCWPPKPRVVTSDYLVHFAFPWRKPTGSCSLEEADLNQRETLSLKSLL